MAEPVVIKIHNDNLIIPTIKKSLARIKTCKNETMRGRLFLEVAQMVFEMLSLSEERDIRDNLAELEIDLKHFDLDKGDPNYVQRKKQHQIMLHDKADLEKKSKDLQEINTEMAGLFEEFMAFIE
jgi:hypothetical protein